MTNSPNDKEEVKIEIPDVTKLMEQPADAFTAMAMHALSRYEVTRHRIDFNSAAGRTPDIIMTPMNDAKKSVLVYTEVEAPLIAAGILVKSEFEKTGKISAARRERFLVEMTKDVLRNFDGLAHNTKDYKDLCDQVMEHVTGQLKSISTLPTFKTFDYQENYTFSANPVAKDNGGSSIPVQTEKKPQP